MALRLFALLLPSLVATGVGATTTPATTASCQDSTLCQCDPESFGEKCDKKVVQFDSHGGSCLDEAGSSEICKGLVYAGSALESHICHGSSVCDHWLNIKGVVETMWEAELGDFIVDLVSIAVGLCFVGVVLWTGKREKDSAVTVSPISVVFPPFMFGCFVADLVLESMVNHRVDEALDSIVQMKESLCFSLGDGYATLVKLEDTAETIKTLAIANIVIAVLGFFFDFLEPLGDICNVFGVQVGFVAATCGMSLLELILGAFSFFAQTHPFVGELEALELAAVGLKELETGFVCYQRHQDLPVTSATGMDWSPQAFWLVHAPWIFVVGWLPCLFVVTAPVWCCCLPRAEESYRQRPPVVVGQPVLVGQPA
eukprot:symbB.v1.2.029715.t1/scaffold3287.1/size59763/2